MAATGAPNGGRAKKGADVAIVASLMAVLLLGMIALVVIVGRSDDKPQTATPASSISVAIASATPSAPVVLIVDPSSTDEPVIASALPLPPSATYTVDPPKRPNAVPKLGLGEDNSSAPLNSDQINDVIDAQRPALKATCFGKITNQPSSAKVAIHIGRDGYVSGVDLLQSAGIPEVAKCVVSQAKTWIFPKSGTEANVQMPFFFK